MDAIVAIGIKTDDGISWIGTGFYVTKLINDGREIIPYLVTNRHIFEGHSEISVRMKRKGKHELVTVHYNLVDNHGNPIYKTHKDKTIDIAVLAVRGDIVVKEGLQISAFDVDEHMLRCPELRGLGVDAGSLIYMLGFPMGLVNEDSLAPICRLGCVARMTEEQICEGHNILVDTQNFPGNSGSPIIIRPEDNSIEGMPFCNKSVLLGIVHSYLPYDKFLIISQTKEIAEKRSENSGIALVHPVELILDVIDLFQ